MLCFSGKEGVGLLADVRNTDDFYIQLGAIAGERLGDASDTIVFLDEIQSYPHLIFTRITSMPCSAMSAALTSAQSMNLSWRKN